MSSAFVKEGESGNLKDVAPELGALLFFLRIENHGISIREEKSYFSEKHGRQVYQMSDGLSYALDDSQHWYVMLS